MKDKTPLPAQVKAAEEAAERLIRQNIEWREKDGNEEYGLESLRESGDDYKDWFVSGYLAGLNAQDDGWYYVIDSLPHRDETCLLAVTDGKEPWTLHNLFFLNQDDVWCYCDSRMPVVFDFPVLCYRPLTDPTPPQPHNEKA